jgi:hypothetical protein
MIGVPMNVWVGILKTFHKPLSVTDWVGMLYYKIGIVRYISALVFIAFLMNFFTLIDWEGVLNYKIGYLDECPGWYSKNLLQTSFGH